MPVQRVARGSCSVEIQTQTVRDPNSGNGVPGARVQIYAPSGSASFEAPLDFLAVMAREFYDVCGSPERAAAMPVLVTRPTPDLELAPTLRQGEKASWIDRAMDVHADLRTLQLEWTTDNIPKVSTLKSGVHDILASVHDFGMVSFWKVAVGRPGLRDHPVGSGEHAVGGRFYEGSEASFDMAFVAASERVIIEFSEQVEQAKKALKE